MKKINDIYKSEGGEKNYRKKPAAFRAVQPKTSSKLFFSSIFSAACNTSSLRHVAFDQVTFPLTYEFQAVVLWGVGCFSART